MFIQTYLFSGGPISLSHASSLLDVNRSSYYKWVSHPGQQHSGSASDIALALRDMVQRIAVEFPVLSQFIAHNETQKNHPMTRHDL